MLAMAEPGFRPLPSPQTGASTPSALPLQFPTSICFCGGIVVSQDLLPPASSGPRSQVLGSLPRGWCAGPGDPCGWLVTHLGRSGPEGSSGWPHWSCSWRRTPGVHGR